MSTSLPSHLNEHPGLTESLCERNFIGFQTENCPSPMENFQGLLKIRVKKGINLAVRDIRTRSSDPYVVVSTGQQRMKTRVVKKNCNPLWNDEFTLSISNLNTPIILTVFDKDRFTEDDKMGNAEIDIKPYLECLSMGLKDLPKGCVVKRIQPNQTNCLSEESTFIWDDGKIVQEMPLRLKNVECGEVIIQIELIVGPGSRRNLGF